MIPADPQAARPEPGTLADLAAESIRTLNHLTPEALEYPGDLYAVIASLKLLSQRLPQLLGQLSGWLDHQHTAGRIAHDTRQDAEPYVQDVTSSLAQAAADAAALADALNVAHNACSGLKAADPPAEGTAGTEDRS